MSRQRKTDLASVRGWLDGLPPASIIFILLVWLGTREPTEWNQARLLLEVLFYGAFLVLYLDQLLALTQGRRLVGRLVRPQ